MADDTDDPLSASTVGAAVRAVDPDAAGVDATPHAGGSETLYFVTAETAAGRRELVLKVRSYDDPGAFRTEPHLLDALAERTSIPVPAVVGSVDDHPELPTPFFVMERCTGERVRAGDLAPDALRRVAFDAGRYLGELHAVGSFDGYGGVRCRVDDPSVRPGVVVGDRVLGVADGSGSWRDWLPEQARAALSALDGRFRDLEADLRAFLAENEDCLDGDGPPVLVDDDYRYGNLLVDPGTGETRAVLDFGNASTATAAYNLVLVEQFLSEFAALDADRRRRIRAALREGYGETNALDPGDGFERRRTYYLVATWIGPLTLLSEWYADAYPAGPDEQARRYRDALSTLLER